MPTHPTRLTDKSAAAIPPPAEGYALYWCPVTSGLALRVTAGGARTWIAERRVDGVKKRRALGRAPGDTGARNVGRTISAEAARKLQVTLSSELQQGIDSREIAKEKRETDQKERLTVADAVREYVVGKRRASPTDKAALIGLKPRTKADYLGMLDAPTVKKAAGELHSIAGKSIHKLTAGEIKDLATRLESRGERRRTYAMQLLRAALRWHGVAIDNNPFSPTTAGRTRVILANSRGNPTPIVAARIGAWWRAACAVNTVSADQLRFQLLTGVRPGEAATLTAGDFDLKKMKLLLRDTKNRRPHTILLSSQAAEIVSWHAMDSKPSAKVFGVKDTGKTIAAINLAAGVDGVSPHDLRATFATIADRLVTAATCRAMLNHAGGTVTERFYIDTEDQLRAGWQAVADFVESAK